MLALRPELVGRPLPHRDNVDPGDSRGFSPYRSEVHGSWQAIRGHTDSPDRADPERGKIYLTTAAQAVAKALIAFYQVKLA
jgi:hypothetical protein